MVKIPKLIFAAAAFAAVLSLDVPAAKTPGLAFYKNDGGPAWGVP